jgi:transcriptional regulator with XRE-family HTH domain
MPANEILLENVQRSLGQRIRDLRTRQGWSQEKFAQVCGLHRTYMGHLERGEKNVSLATVLRVANALGIRLGALFARVPTEAAVSVPISYGQAAPDFQDVTPLLDELRHQRRTLRHAIRDLTALIRPNGHPRGAQR